MALLTGMTPDGQEVPVQVDSSGRLVAEGLTGPEGPAGPTGPTGPTGPAGPAGDSQWVKNGQDISYAQGRVAIGTTSPSATLQVSPSSGSANFQVSRGSKGLQINQDNDSADPNINTTGATALRFLRDGDESMRIDTSGRLLVGTSSSSAEAKFIVQGGATAAGGVINIQRNATTASAGSTIGFINFANSASNVGATIAADGDGTWSAGTSHPTRLVLSTTADGASSPSEAMKIDSRQRVCIKSPNGNWWSLQVSDSGALSAVAV